MALDGSRFMTFSLVMAYTVSIVQEPREVADVIEQAARSASR